MTEKECAVYIVDIGKSMGVKRHGRTKTDLEWSMEYVWDKISAAVATGRKTLYSGVLALRSDKTNPCGLDEDEYPNIDALKHPTTIVMPHIRELNEKIKPSHTNSGDAVSAIVVAIKMIDDFCGTKKYKKSIILVTRADGSLDSDGIEDIAEKLKHENISITVLGVDLDDLEYGYKEEDKDESKEANEKALKSLVDHANGNIGTLQQATDELKLPRVKIPRSMPTFRGKLSLGDSSTYDSALEIDVERYPKVMMAPAQSARKVVMKSGDSAQTQDGTFEAEPPKEEGETVHASRIFQVKDESAPSGKRDVDREELSKGYEYGRTAVAVEPSDEATIRLDSTAGMDILGFVPRENIEPFLEMSRTSVVIAQKTNDLAQMALSSFIHTLYELDTCAIARLVKKDNAGPVIVALTPLIEPDYECLIDVEIPFAEDFRQHKFPPLDRIPTLSGKVVTEHRLLPSNDLQDAMSAYVKSMDLSEADRDEEGEKTDYLKLEDSYSPKIHRLQEAVKHRAIHPDIPLPPPNDVLLRYTQPPEHVVKKAQKHLDRLTELAEVKKVLPKSLSRRNYRGRKAQEAPRSGLDVNALLNERTAANKHRISPENAIPEFKQILANAENEETIRECVTQLGSIIEKWVRDSMGDSNYGRVIEAIRTMREECIELEEPAIFNDFLKGLKGKLFKEELGGDRRELWWQLRTGKLGLIEKKASSQSTVGEDEARQFMIPDRSRT